MGYLWWERWEERPPSTSRSPTWISIALLALAVGHLPLRLLLTPFPLWPAALAMHLAIVGVIALLGAWAVAGTAGVRWVAGPLVLTLSTLPVPSTFETGLILPLREQWAAAAAEISNLVGSPAIAAGTSIQTGGGWIGVDEACGGIRSLQACVMIGLFFGEWYRFTWGRRLALLAAGLLAALAGNFGRVIFLCLYGQGRAETIHSVHDPVGWIAMTLSLALTGLLACHWAGWSWPAPRPGRPLRTTTVSKNWRWPAAAAAVLLVGEVLNFAWFSLGEAQQREVPRWTVQFPGASQRFKSEPLSAAANEMLRPDFFAAGQWDLGREAPAAGYYVEWRRGQVARSVPFLHNPTVCLPLAGCELKQALAPIHARWSAGDIRFFAYKFRRIDRDLLVLFTIWDTARGQPLTEPAALGSKTEWLLSQWREVAEARQHQPAQLLALYLPWTDAPADLAQEVLSQLIISHP